MPTKRKNSPVAAASVTNKRRRGSGTYRGRRDAGTNYQPRQTRSRAAPPGASPLMVLDNDRRPTTQQPQLMLKLKKSLDTIKAASPVLDGAKTKSPNHVLDDLIIYSAEVASNLNNFVAPGLGNILDEVILGSIPVAIEPKKLPARIDDQGELILDSIEPNDFIASEETSPYPLTPPVSPSLVSPAPRGGGGYGHDGNDWSMFEQGFSFNARDKRSSSDGSIDLYAIPEYQPTRSFEDIMREFEEEDEGEVELIYEAGHLSNAHGNDEYVEDGLDLGWPLAEDDGITPTESQFELLYWATLGCESYHSFALAEQQPELASNSHSINMKHSREQKQHHNPHWNEIQNVDYNIDPALLIPTPPSPHHPPSISTPIPKREFSSTLEQDTTTNSHPYYTHPQTSDSDSSSSDEQQSSSDSDDPSLQSPRSNSSSSESGDDGWCEYPDNPDDCDGDGSGGEEEEELEGYDGNCYCQYRPQEEVHVDAVIEAAQAAAEEEELRAGEAVAVGVGEGETMSEEEEELVL